jgi:transcription initiation factor TFIID subunit 1
MLQKRTGVDVGRADGDGSPEPTTERGTGTTRKCANCGQVGHIKTNKKCAKKKPFNFFDPTTWDDQGFGGGKVF